MKILNQCIKNICDPKRFQYEQQQTQFQKAYVEYQNCVNTSLLEAGISNMTSNSLQISGAISLIDNSQQVAHIFESCAQSTHKYLSEIQEYKECQLSCLNKAVEFLSKEQSSLSVKSLAIIITLIVSFIIIVVFMLLYKISQRNKLKQEQMKQISYKDNFKKQESINDNSLSSDKKCNMLDRTMESPLVPMPSPVRDTKYQKNKIKNKIGLTKLNVEKMKQIVINLKQEHPSIASEDTQRMENENSKKDSSAQQKYNLPIEANEKDLAIDEPKQETQQQQQQFQQQQQLQQQEQINDSSSLTACFSFTPSNQFTKEAKTENEPSQSPQNSDENKIQIGLHEQRENLICQASSPSQRSQRKRNTLKEGENGNYIYNISPEMSNIQSAQNSNRFLISPDNCTLEALKHRRRSHLYQNDFNKNLKCIQLNELTKFREIENWRSSNSLIQQSLSSFSSQKSEQDKIKSVREGLLKEFSSNKNVDIPQIISFNSFKLNVQTSSQILVLL